MKLESDISFVGPGFIPTNRRVIRDIREYVDAIEWLKDTYDQTILWFRGVSHATHRLVPSLYRNKTLRFEENIEQELMGQFVRAAVPYVADHSSWTKWEWYWTMQNYGLPTRLLDWTESSLVALYFAVRQHENVATPTVWVMDPWWLNKTSKPGYEMVYMPHPLLDEPNESWIKESYLGSRDKLSVTPLAIMPPFTNTRISAQQSVYTIHGKLVRGFEAAIKDIEELPRIFKLRMSTSKALLFKQALQTMGVTESTLFPDLEGVARTIKWDFGF